MTSQPSRSGQPQSTAVELLPDVPQADRPRHIAIIMDGNGRWAQHRGLPRIEGHRHGVRTVRTVTETAARLKIEALTLYCLSSENWKRPQAELDFLMHLMEQYLIEERRTLMENDMRLRVIGRRDRLPHSVITEMNRTLELVESNRGTIVVLAIDYGGRDEITRTLQAISAAVLRGELQPDQICEQTISDRLFTAGLPEVDLMIRTGGDMRVSNFLLWQLSYAEIWVVEKYWPDFAQEDFLRAIREFVSRQRRFGGLGAC